MCLSLGVYILTLTEVTKPSYFGEPLVLDMEVTVIPQRHEKEVTFDRLIKSRMSKDSASDKLKSKTKMGQSKS